MTEATSIEVDQYLPHPPAQVWRALTDPVRRNRGAAGVDKVSIQMFADNLEENLAALMRELKTGTFRPRPLRRVLIPKGPGTTKLRPLGIPVVRDRVAQVRHVAGRLALGPPDLWRFG